MTGKVVLKGGLYPLIMQRTAVPANEAEPLTFSVSNFPAVVPAISKTSVPPDPCAKFPAPEPLMARAPVVTLGEERLGLSTPAVLVTFPVMVPLPSTLPACSPSGVVPDIEMVPPSRRVEPLVCVKELPSKSVPVLAMTVPVLLKTIVLPTPPPLTPVPDVFSNVPALLKVGAVPPSNSICVSASWFQVAPALLLITDPFSIRTAEPVQVAVPTLFRVRVSRNGSPEIVIPPLAFVTPLPLSVPPDQVSVPLTVTVSLPVSVPPLCVSVVVEIVLPVEKFSVPELIVSGPVLVTVTGETKFAVPPLTIVPPVML